MHVQSNEVNLKSVECIPAQLNKLNDIVCMPNSLRYVRVYVKLASCTGLYKILVSSYWGRPV